jgi:FAD/FMN-containing dehydrogenase
LQIGMTVMGAIAKAGHAAARDLRAVMRGKVVLPDDDAYELTREVWNGAVDHRPALFAICATAEDVKAAVRVAQARGLPFSVRGGGHDWAGRALRHEGLVIDLSAMRQVTVDATARIATIAGGARAKDVIAATAPHGLTAVTGNCGAVGMAGLTLGGGYGPLSPLFGLALDNLLGVEIVLADGRCIMVDELEYPDLFWALRGGGGNFGVVTSMRVRLHPVRELLAGLILFLWSDAAGVLNRYARLLTSAPDELAVTAGVLSGPDRVPALFLAPTWSGEMQGEQAMDSLKALGTPIVAKIGPMTCIDHLNMFDAEVVNGRRYALQTRWLPELTPDAIASFVAAGSKRTSRFSLIALHHFHGMPTRIAPDATAFGIRREHFLVEAIAAWEPGDDESADTHREWARHLSRVLAPMALPGGYANLLGSDEHDQISLAYGTNIDRLREVKRRFDPNHVFSAIPLPAPEANEHPALKLAAQ